MKENQIRELVNELRDIAVEYHGTQQLRERIARTVRAAMIQAGNSPVTPDDWVSCSERMPDDKQYVWFFGESRGFAGRDTLEGYYDWSRNKWWAVTYIGEEPASKVTHWMPLPEPPQEEK
ncbi:DUF551 domain-containing protein [Salmonella enterica]|nr:DUF551 domain-containing protein [Salmonella enterica]